MNLTSSQSERQCPHRACSVLLISCTNCVVCHGSQVGSWTNQSRVSRPLDQSGVSIHLVAGGAGEVPGHAAGGGGGLDDEALQDAVAEGVSRVQLQPPLLGEQAPPPGRLNSGDGRVRAEEIHYNCPVSSVQCPVSSVQCPVSSVQQCPVHLMKVGVMRRLCSWPGGSRVWLLPKLLGVSSGPPSRTLKALIKDS